MRKLFLILASILCTALVAQRPYFEHLGVSEDGLPTGKVYTVVQDSSGLVWMGTEAGLVSYDGIRARTFGESDGISAASVRSLFLDRSGHLWAGHKDGSITRSEGLRLERVALDALTIQSDITGITQDATGAVWISTMGQGVLRIGDASVEGPLKVEVMAQEKGIIDYVISLQTLADGTLAAIEDGSTLKKWDATSGRFADLEWPGLEDKVQVTSVFIDSDGRIWMGTPKDGVSVLDPKSGQVVDYSQANGLKSNYITCIGEDATGQVWVGMHDGGVAVIGLNGVRRSYHPDSGFPAATLLRIARDREGNMLLATFDNGLFIFKGDRFLNFIEEDGLQDPQVWAVLEDRGGRVWFGTNGGITVLDPKAGGTGIVRTISMQKGELTSNQVRSLCEDTRGHIWIGTETGGIIEMDPDGYGVIDHSDLLAVIPDGKVTSLVSTPDGSVWVGAINGLKRYQPGLPPIVFGESEGVPTREVSALAIGTNGAIWIGTKGEGVTLLQGERGQQLEAGKILNPTCFATDTEGRMWVGTENQGIVVVKDGNETAHYTQEQGLLSNAIRSMVRDKDGHIWIGTSKGLNKWRPKQDGFLSFTQRSGFIGTEAKPNAAILTRGGDLWFGTNGGATRITAEKGAERSLPPVVSIAGLRVNDEEREPVRGLDLSHTERKVRIDFRCVSLSDPSAVRYQFMLTGLDEDWQPMTHEASATYPVLPPGSYTFKVKAMNRAGQWSAPLEYAFIIHPPWYRSWWFYSLLAVTLALALFSFIKVRTRQLRLRNQILEQRVEERTAEVVAQSKEIEGQKVRIEDLLLNILPKEISEELKEKGKATARRHEEVSVLFTDMKGFTKAAEKMTPEELVNELDECFIHFDEIVGRYGIEKIKTIGDSYMCAAGVPTRDVHHAYKCALAALEVRDLMEEQRQQRESQGKDPWILRIGVNTGPVVAGVVGRRKFAYDIWGDTVNTASRMESSGEPGQVNISGSTYALVKDRFECDHRGQIEAKNKGAIDMYFIRRIKAEWCSDPEGRQPNERFLKAIGLNVTQDQFA